MTRFVKNFSSAQAALDGVARAKDMVPNWPAGIEFEVSQKGVHWHVLAVPQSQEASEFARRELAPLGFRIAVW